MSKSSNFPIRLADLSESVTALAETQTVGPSNAAPTERFVSQTSKVRSTSPLESYEQLCDFLEQSTSTETQLPKPPETAGIWGINFHAITMDQTLDYLEQVIQARQPSYVVTAYLNYAMISGKNPRLQAFTQRAALVLCDGIPALWRSKLGRTKLPERVAGADLIYRLSERCAAKKLRVYFYGASEGVAEKAALKLKQKRNPNSVISGGRMLGTISLNTIHHMLSPRSLADST